MSTILVIDDEPTICLLVRSTLENAGFQVIEAANGILGLKRAQLEQPDLILLDIALPQMSGLEVSRRLQESAKTASIPVLYLTGLVPESEPNSPPSVQGYIAKPFTPSVLVERIAAALPRQRATIAR